MVAKHMTLGLHSLHSVGDKFVIRSNLANGFSFSPRFSEVQSGACQCLSRFNGFES